MKVQQAILSALHQLNQETCSLNDIAPHLVEKCDVGFELGAAEGIDFHYLDKVELDRFEKGIVEKEVPMLDFLCAIRYHVVKYEGKLAPLKFDYHLLRFIFHENSVKLQICHERGPQRLPLEDLVTFVAERINKELSQKQLEPLNLEYLGALY